VPVGALPKRAGVLGWPVAHSRSPAIHEAAYRALGLDDWRYQLLPVPPELLAETVVALPAAGFVGVNVTIPHKQAAVAVAAQVTDRAREIGAANTLTFRNGVIEADNTDAPGLIAALPRPVDGTRAMVLGAGGGARAAVWALRGAGAEVIVWNRTPARARELCSALGGQAVERPEPADLLVNCTAVGLARGSSPWSDLALSPADMRAYGCVVDLVYGAGETELIAAARRAGAAVVDGLEVLVRQGALSLEHWTGRTAPLEVMRAAAQA
jgi:shikimate dehydrogenase